MKRISMGALTAIGIGVGTAMMVALDGGTGFALGLGGTFVAYLLASHVFGRPENNS